MIYLACFFALSTNTETHKTPNLLNDVVDASPASGAGFVVDDITVDSFVADTPPLQEETFVVDDIVVDSVVVDSVEVSKIQLPSKVATKINVPQKEADRLELGLWLLDTAKIMLTQEQWTQALKVQ